MNRKWLSRRRAWWRRHQALFGVWQALVAWHYLFWLCDSPGLPSEQSTRSAMTGKEESSPWKVKAGCQQKPVEYLKSSCFQGDYCFLGNYRKVQLSRGKPETLGLGVSSAAECLPSNPAGPRFTPQPWGRETDALKGSKTSAVLAKLPDGGFPLSACPLLGETTKFLGY